jgi:hypothetical protein
MFKVEAKKDSTFKRTPFFLFSHFNLTWNAFSLILHAEIVDTFDSEPLKAENIAEDFSAAEDTFEVIDAPSVATYDSYPDPDSDFFGGKFAIYDAWVATHINVSA